MRAELPPRTTLRLLRLWPWLVVAPAAAAGLLFERESRGESHAGRLVLAAFAVLLLALGGLRARAVARAPVGARGGPGGRGRVLLASWLVLCVLGTFNYYQFDRRVFTTVGDYADATYYYLNSKYFEELGYTRLYHAMLVADAEEQGRLRRVPRYRDLVDYQKLIPRHVALERAADVKSHFGEERWRSFRSDLNYITRRSARGGWAYFFIDHGYNPPPTWTLLGSFLARFAPVEALKRITSVDMGLVVLMFAGVAWAFGSRALLVALAFYLCTFSGRWPILGQSILRFDWLAALVLCVVFLKRQRHGLAGACLAYAALIRVFPAIFGLPYLVVLVRDTLRTRRLSRGHRNFVVGASLCVVLLGGGSLWSYGVGAWQDAIVNLKLHGSPESYSSHRVGLGDALLYRGEWSLADLQAGGGIESKRLALWALEPYLRALGLLSILFVGWYVWRSREPVHRLIWLGVLPLFCLTNPQINYYNLRLILVLWHMERFDERFHRFSLIGLFAVEAATQWAQVAGATRYAVTCITSWGLLLYLLAQIVALGRTRRAAPQPATSGSALPLGAPG